MAIFPIVFTKIIALFVLTNSAIKTTFAVTSSIGCPQKCKCLQFRFVTGNTLKIDCGRRDLNESVLRQELDLLLSHDKFKENLTYLSITDTPLTQVPMSVCQLTNLGWLILNGNRLTQLKENCFTNLKGLVFLSATRNNITELQDGLFDGLNSLEILDFTNNMIASIGLRVFSNPHDLLNLHSISLANNRLRSLEPWPYIRGLHRSQDRNVHISMESNLIAKFTNNISWHFNCSLPSYAFLNIAHNHVRHLSDMLDGWNITSLTEWFCLMHLADSDYDDYNPLAFRVNFQHSFDYHCDCVDIDFYAHSRHFGVNRIFMNIKCSHPQSLVNRFVNQVPLNEFVCEVSDRCSSNCQCVYRPANSTFHVDCSAANFSSLPLDLPPLPRNPDKYKLDFSNNRLLRRLQHRPYLVNTFLLDVSNSSVDSVDLDAWREFEMMPSELYDFAPSTITHVRMPRAVAPAIFLHGNKINSFSVEVTEINLISVHLTLNDNPWKCYCGNRWMITWFKSLYSGASPNVDDVLCESPPRLEGRSILKSDEVDFCVDPLKRMLKIVLSSILSVAAVLLVLGFAVYFLRVRIYKRWKFHPFDRDECVGEEMDYDVFLCCSSEDNNVHGSRILQLMESKGYRVCYHLRDFIPGELIADNMIQSIMRSKRTVCFVSRNFLRR